MFGQYVLVGQTPVPEPNPERWAEWLQRADRMVARDIIGPYLVSTVFLGFDHSWREEGPPLLFETAVFGEGDHSDVMERYATWSEAEHGHRMIVSGLEKEKA